jgi:hypothetical protein
MAGSAADAISQAVERSKQLLFPLKGEKWFALGFTVFLAQCGEGSGTVQIPSMPSGSSGPSGSSSGAASAGAEFQKMLDDALRALNADLALYVSLAIAGVVLTFGIWLLVLWFSSRAKLMFVESVIWDRVDVSSQWSRAADLGMSLFKFRAAVSLGGSVLVLLSMGAAVVAALPDFQAGNFLGHRAVIGYLLLGFTLLFMGLPLGIALLLLDDFVVPLMVLRNARVVAAWGMCRAEVLSGNIGGVILFYLLRVMLSVAIAIATAVLTCATCCLTMLPYLGTVMLLPIFVFSRAYPLYYLEQLGIQVFPAADPAWAYYDQWRFPR